MSYHSEFLSHISEIKLKVTASTKEELFQGALAGMASILGPKISPSLPRIEEMIELQSLNLNTLLVDFLSEILTKVEISGIIFTGAQINNLTNTSLQAKLIGFKTGVFQTQIKAVTHHGLDITQDKNGIYQVIILFDI